jgi:hypothetical protein
MLLDLGHMLRGQHIWQEWENPKHESVWCPHCGEANTETLKRQRSIWEGDQEVVKRSGRDESIWVVTHPNCVEAMLGISLYSYPYLNWQKHYVFLIIAYFYTSTKLEKRAERICLEVRGAGGEGRGRGHGAGGRSGPWPNVCTDE